MSPPRRTAQDKLAAKRKMGEYEMLKGRFYFPVCPRLDNYGADTPTITRIPSYHT